ncbi:isoprenyl transferase [Cesiribacter andamanensis]|uniref:Isoprenyl transferase n=1 Tax=Cesiribacter andamanensis AMV16 TaxID=1279009 RepID=M7N919_9BACT|nr:isoprenyl transferase [Cesiribacter andamanensis]EMR03747.1 Undecaprenyl pyrophosphate synthase [Cesiribacter andamanensis AMV16]
MKERLDLHNLPRHIAVIMDGNGRWAKKQGAARVFGHKNAILAVRETTESCAELGIQHLTLYAFSTENWNRPRAEVNALMELLVSTIRKEISTLQDNNVRLNHIGNLHDLPTGCQHQLNEAMAETKKNTGLTLTLALSYSGRWEILEAAKKLMQAARDGVLAPEALTPALFEQQLTTHDMPDPELLIRTSGEMRISNFLLWQLAYTELYISEVLWPDFRKEHLYEAIYSYQQRERRFGKTSEQINLSKQG